jgi:hypothetical protein
MRLQSNSLNKGIRRQGARTLPQIPREQGFPYRVGWASKLLDSRQQEACSGEIQQGSSVHLKLRGILRKAQQELGGEAKTVADKSVRGLGTLRTTNSTLRPCTSTTDQHAH